MTRRSRDAGFTLLEVMAALGVFAIVTLGIVPLLGSALRASSTSRSETVAKEAAVNVMERIQGIKWYVSYDAKPNKRVDILDLYYPQAASNAAMGQTYSATATNSPLVGNGGTGSTGGVFTTVCPPPTTTNPACNFDRPAGSTVTIKASFVKKHSPATTPETYDMVTPAATYAWNSQNNDAPAAPLMDVNVTVSWTAQGKARSYSLRAIVGDRKFVAPAAVDAGPSPSPSASSASGPAKVSGNASIDYVAQAQTRFFTNTAQPATGCPTGPCYSDANMTFGIAESRINTEDTGSTADQSNQVADFTITRAYPTTAAPPPTPPPDLASQNVSYEVKHAPPASFTAAGPLTPPTVNLTHPDFSNAVEALIYGGQNTGMKVDIANELPVAEGGFQTYGTTNGIPEGYFTNNLIDTTNYKVSLANGFGYFTRCIGCGYPVGRLGTQTSANTYALTAANRSVETKATAGFGIMTMPRFSGTRAWDAFDIQGFNASVDCKSTANPATAVATATWSATITGFYDPTNNTNTPNNGTAYTLTINSNGNDTFNGASVPDAIASLKALNPLEHDASTNAADIYLFEKRDPATGLVSQKGYISDIVPLENPPTSISADGRTTSASIDGAIRIDTGQLAASIPEASFNVSLGKVSCEAVDNR